MPVYLTSGFPASKFLVFYVKDTGIGIPKDSLELIFDRFKKVENKRLKLYGGAGLGLAISKNLTTRLGGKIWAESTECKGSTFYFTLPIEQTAVSNKQSEDTKKSTAIANERAYDWSNKTILVVEDEDFVSKFFDRILTPTHANLLWAKTGMEAFESCRKNNGIDIVLMDMKLPELSGYEAVKRIKKLNISLHIIAQTAYAMAEDRIECLKAGCGNDYISKPIDTEMLLEKIQLVFDKTGQRNE